MRQFVNVAANSILQHFQARVNYLDLLTSLGTTAEEWFRIELLDVLRAIPAITITATNQQVRNAANRPDFTLNLFAHELLLELKVLPKDRNYPYGWQRFQAGKNNKKDFQHLVSGVRQGIIYVYWPDLADWQGCRANIETAYSVECVSQDQIACGAGHTILSYWGLVRDDAQPGAAALSLDSTEGASKQ
jgi:hypothetical protein